MIDVGDLIYIILIYINKLKYTQKHHKISKVFTQAFLQFLSFTYTKDEASFHVNKFVKTFECSNVFKTTK